ncbi:MAG: alpha/beta hydrolase [Chloroflexia bacterium]
MFIAGRGDPTPFEAWRGTIGALLLHGFPGSPAEVRELGAYLAERGISVIAPLLPGHGRQPEALRGVRWSDWVQEAERARQRLQEHCTSVLALGLSAGAALSLYLAGKSPLSGVVAVSPAVKLRNPLAPLLPLARLFLRWVVLGEDADLADPTGPERQWYYTRAPASAVAEMYALLRAAWRAAARVDVPVLIFQGRRDGVLRPEGAEALLRRIPSAEKRLIWLERSGHNALVDAERETVFREAHAFIEAVARR